MHIERVADKLASVRTSWYGSCCLAKSCCRCAGHQRGSATDTHYRRWHSSAALPSICHVWQRGRDGAGKLARETLLEAPVLCKCSRRHVSLESLVGVQRPAVPFQALSQSCAPQLLKCCVCMRAALAHASSMHAARRMLQNLGLKPSADQETSGNQHVGHAQRVQLAQHRSGTTSCQARRRCL